MLELVASYSQVIDRKHHLGVLASSSSFPKARTLLERHRGTIVRGRTHGAYVSPGGGHSYRHTNPMWRINHGVNKRYLI